MKVFHHNDLDGRAAGAVINHFREGKSLKADRRRSSTSSNEKIDAYEFIEMEYSREFPLDSISINEQIYIVDFHVQNDDDFRKLQAITQNITLIDHHKSTVEHREKHPELYSNIESIITSARSGCWLTWEYFVLLEMKAEYFDDNAKIIIPKAIQLIDDMDRWIWDYEETENFTTGMKLYSHQPTDEVWVQLLSRNAGSLIARIIERGITCVQYDNMISNDYCNAYGFEATFEGHKTFAQGMYRGGSKAFGERIKQYPLLISFEFTGDKWIIGLYSETIDVSEIAVRHGGGGHRGAAGFVCDELPFSKDVKRIEI
jgi:oligoribonuclease NrnB/cAMP/cGMP phosphodiesterase (DHH superfamily)